MIEICADQLSLEVGEFTNMRSEKVTQTSEQDSK